MLDLKEFEKSLNSVTQDEIRKKKVRGHYVPYIQAILHKANLLPAGKACEVDVREPKFARGLALSIQQYLVKVGEEENFAAGHYRTFVFCGKRNGEAAVTNKKKS